MIDSHSPVAPIEHLEQFQQPNRKHQAASRSDAEVAPVTSTRHSTRRIRSRHGRNTATDSVRSAGGSSTS